MAILIMAVVLSIGLGISAILISQIKMLRGMTDSVIAFYAADSGIEDVLYKDKLCRQTGCDILAWVCVDTINCDDGILSTNSCGVSFNFDICVNWPDGTVRYEVGFDDGAVGAVTSVGTYKGTKRAIEISR